MDMPPVLLVAAIGLLLGFLLTASAGEAYTNYTCFGSLSQLNTSQYVLINASATQINTTEDTNCPEGCDNQSGRCREISQNSAMLPLAYAVLALSFFYISTKIEGHILLKSGLFVIALTMVSLSAGTGLEISQTNIPVPFSNILVSGTVYTVWILRFGAMYMLIMVILELVFFIKKNILDKSNARRRR